MDAVSKLNPFEIRVLIKLATAQATINPTVDQVYLPSLVDRLQKALVQKGRGAGTLDMRDGDFDFKFRFSSSYRVEAIKLIRVVMGVGLKEAKDISDIGYEETLPWGEITFINADESLYRKFVKGHADIRGFGWNASVEAETKKSNIQIIPISIPTSAPEVQEVQEVQVEPT